MFLKTNRHWLFAGLMILTCVTQAKTMTLQVKYMSTAPVIDGQITGDSAWTKLVWHGNFKTYRSGAPVMRKTRFKLGYGDDSFYLAVECEDPGIGKLNISTLDLNPILWRDDTIEIFFSTRDDFSLEQFIVNAAGARSNTKIVKSIFTQKDYLWNWNAKVQRKTNSWRLEAKIPYSLIDFSRGVLNNLRFNLGRTSTAINELSSWAPQPKLFLESANFAKLLLEDHPALERIRQNYPAIMLAEEFKQLAKTWQKQKKEWFGSQNDFCRKLLINHQSEINEIDSAIQKSDSLNMSDYHLLAWKINQFFKKMTQLDKEVMD